MTATPIVPVNGVAVQQWMCATVVVPDRPLHCESMDKVCAVSSNTTVTMPLPVAPTASGCRRDSKVKAAAWAVAGTRIRLASTVAANTPRVRVGMHAWTNLRRTQCASNSCDGWAAMCFDAEVSSQDPQNS